MRKNLGCPQKCKGNANRKAFSRLCSPTLSPGSIVRIGSDCFCLAKRFGQKYDNSHEETEGTERRSLRPAVVRSTMAGQAKFDG